MSLSTTEIHRAQRNEPVGTFTLTNPKTKESREFELMDLDYDSYIEFMDLARPIITSVYNSFALENSGGEIKLGFDPMGLDFQELLKLSGNELPKMAWLCCRMSDPKIKIADVKRLGHRPHLLLEVVLMQIKHNQIVQEFADFFPRIAKAIEDLAPKATTDETTLPADTTAETTPAS
jgi:hypothetical protein